LETGARRADSTAVQQRQRLQATAKVCAVVCDALVRSGIDPASTFALHRDEAETAELAGLGEKSDWAGADEKFATPDGDVLADAFFAKIGDMAQRYQDGQQPEFARASLAELFAWCSAQPAQAPQSNLAPQLNGPQPNLAHTPAPLPVGIVE
jgi:hypothetical protein